MSYPTMSNPWRDIRALTAWLDDNAQYGPESERILRCLKLSEEVGEVASAIIGVTGQNPRKGVTHGWTDVCDELCDVIVTAMVALTTVTPDAEDRFAAHLESVTGRVGLSGTDHTNHTGETMSGAPDKTPAVGAHLVDGDENDVDGPAEYVDYEEAAAVREIRREMDVEAGDDSEFAALVAEDDARAYRTLDEGDLATRRERIGACTRCGSLSSHDASDCETDL